MTLIRTEDKNRIQYSIFFCKWFFNQSYELLKVSTSRPQRATRQSFLKCMVLTISLSTQQADGGCWKLSKRKFLSLIKTRTAFVLAGVKLCIRASTLQFVSCNITKAFQWFSPVEYKVRGLACSVSTGALEDGVKSGSLQQQVIMSCLLQRRRNEQTCKRCFNDIWWCCTIV